MEYNKLVRDNVIDIMLEQGLTVKYRKVNEKEKSEMLFNKIKEEIAELETSVNGGYLGEIVEEVADVLTVLEAIREYYGITMQDVIYELKRNNIKKIAIGSDLKSTLLINQIKSFVDNIKLNLDNEEANIILTFGNLQLNILAILDMFDINKQEMISVKESKLNRKGSFKKSIFLIEAE